MKIITVTLSPAIDVHCRLPSLNPGHEHLATVTSKDIGGKGINISRVLTANNVRNTALVVLGEESAAAFSARLSKEGINHCDFIVSGRVRENITFLADDGTETRISFSSLVESNNIWQSIESKLFSMVESDSIVTVTGRIPYGVSIEKVKDTLRRLKEYGVKVVVDSRSFAKKDLIECRPWLIKPNEEELEQYVYEKVTTPKHAASIAEAFYEMGIDNVMISLGAQGAVLVCDRGGFLATPPSVSVASTVGAGDSAIAGFLAGYIQGSSSEECLRLAVAYGTASCLFEGTCVPSQDLITKIHSQINLQIADK